MEQSQSIKNTHHVRSFDHFKNVVTSLVASINDDDAPHQEELGFGFAVFFHIVGFILSSAVSIYLSPLITGTKNESKILSTPQNIDGTDSPSAPLPTANAVPDLYAGYPEPPSALNKI